MSNWISVKDRLPEGEEDVLVFNGKFIFIGNCGYTADKRFHTWKVFGQLQDISHWMPLPKKPI